MRKKLKNTRPEILDGASLQYAPENELGVVFLFAKNRPPVPKHLQVIELKREFGLGLNVWVMSVDGPYKEELSRTKSCML